MELVFAAVALGAIVFMARRNESVSGADEGFSVQTLSPEWWHSNTADRLGLDNSPDAAAVENLLRLKSVIEEVFPQGFVITNAYRTPELNAALKDAGYAAATHSLHLDGRAADIAVNGLNPYAAAAVANASGRFVEVIPYNDGHLHVAI